MAGWSEDDSTAFLAAAEVVTPSRAEVMAMFAALTPWARGEAFLAVELGCGGGDLGAHLLGAFGAMRYLGLDGSARMRAVAGERVRPFGERASVRPFRLESGDWRTTLGEGVGLVVSSLAIHHLDGPAKRRLYRDLFDALCPGGALLVLDLVMPTAPVARTALAQAWDDVVREQSLALTGSDAAYRAFVERRENIYRHPDPADMPDSLFAQLRWLEEAGFGHVDAFWQRGAHALFGGYRDGA